MDPECQNIIYEQDKISQRLANSKFILGNSESLEWMEGNGLLRTSNWSNDLLWSLQSN